jgi:hypothetical protein
MWLFLLASLPYVLVLAFLAYNLWAMWVIYSGAPLRRPRDITHEDRPPEPRLVRLGDDLRSLGFARLGEAAITVPALGLIAMLSGRNMDKAEWIYVDPTCTTVAEMVTPGLVVFSSRLADGLFVETSYPSGYPMDVPGLRVTVVATSLRDAFTRHLAEVAQAAAHGSPGRITSMAEWSARDADVRAQHARRHLRPAFVRHVVLPVAIATVVVVAMLVATLSFTASVQ